MTSPREPSAPSPGRDDADSQRPDPALEETLEMDAEGHVGSTIAGRYEIRERLGAGAMGTVYRAEHVRIGRQDAIKLLNPDLADDDDAWARFTREARNASHITHPNVCTVYDFGETDDGLPFIAMEYVEGETLTRLLQREGPLSPARVLELTEEIADALQAAHERGIVHRDLKPENIMLARGDRGASTVKVVDFGIAKAVQDEEAGQDLTRPGFALGTPRYVSPEQVSGGAVDRRSDLYSLGVVLYEMLSGRLPFTGDSWREVMTKRLSEDPVPLGEVAPEGRVGPALGRVIHRALSRDPDDRFEDVGAMVRALREAIPEDAAGAGPGARRGAASGGAASVLRPGGWPAGWRRPVLGLLLLAGLAGAGWIGVRALGAGDAPTDGEPAATEPGSRVAAGPAADGARGGRAEADGRGDGGGGPAGGQGETGGGAESGRAGSGGEGAAGAEGAEAERAAPADRSDGAEPGASGSGDGGGPPGGPSSWVAGLSPAAVDSVLLRQQDALAFGRPGPSRLAAVAETARAVWNARDQPDRNRGLAAYLLGRSLLERGDTARAVDWVEEATALEPDAQGYRRLLRGLREGGR